MTEWAKKSVDQARDMTSNLDLGALAGVPREVFADLLRSMPDADRAAVRGWAERAVEIRDDNVLERAEKEKRLQALDTNQTLYRLIRGSLEALADRAPAKRRRLVKNGLAIAAVATTTLNFEIAGLALIALRAGLPAFVLSDAGETFCRALLAHTGDDEPAARLNS